MKFVVALLLLLQVETSHAFTLDQSRSSTALHRPFAPMQPSSLTVLGRSTKKQGRTHQQHHRQSTTRLFVFERMSEDSIGVIVAAQEQANKLQLPEVGTETLMVGCLENPSSPALQRTMKQYSITFRKGQSTLEQMYQSEEGEDNKGWLSGFRAARDNDNDRPFAKEAQQTFVRAGRLADQMASPKIEPYHIFLALLEYQEKADGGKFAAVVENDVCTCGGWAVLVKMDTFDDTEVTALNVCQSLLNNLLENVQTDQREKRELVTGTGSGGKTPTLEECGTDLTQLAEDGLLDPVYGRDEEIRSCMRTLIRRRKNNVCLLG